MNLKSVVHRLTTGDIAYVLGRFPPVRDAYGGLRRLGHGDDAESPIEIAATHFPNADIAEIAANVRRDAIHVGLTLDAETVGEIREFARTQPLHASYDPEGPTFLYGDIVAATAPDGRSLSTAGVSRPERCPAIRSIIEDPILRAIVRRCLGHEPRTIRAILEWTIASSMTDEERLRLRHRSIEYHYDVSGYNFIYAFFYITDTDRHSGAHVMMRGSHRGKPLRMLLGTARAQAAEVHRQFGAERELLVEGPAGTGFIEDASCYHRATPPTASDRLMLSIRFIN